MSKNHNNNPHRNNDGGNNPRHNNNGGGNNPPKGGSIAGEVARDMASAAFERTAEERRLAEENAKLREALAQHDAAQAAGFSSDEEKQKYYKERESTKRSADTKQTCVAIALIGAIAYSASKIWGR